MSRCITQIVSPCHKSPWEHASGSAVFIRQIPGFPGNRFSHSKNLPLAQDIPDNLSQN